MDNPFGAQISERELAEKIIFLHDYLRLGFRKIAEKLTSRGFKMSKDKAHRLYHEYRTHSVDVEEDEELKQLKEAEMEGQKRLRLLRQKEERRKCIAILAVEEVDAKFERRQELFEDKEALLRFARTVLPVINPALWLRLTNFCNIEEVDLAEAILDAVGSQADYEEVRMERKKENRNYLFDEHLCLYIEDWLLQQQGEELDEEAGDSVDEEPNITIHVVEAPKECVKIPLAPSTREWVDSQGFFHILIAPDDEYITIPLAPRAREWVDHQGFVHIYIPQDDEEYVRIPLAPTNEDSE